MEFGKYKYLYFIIIVELLLTLVIFVIAGFFEPNLEGVRLDHGGVMIFVYFTVYNLASFFIVLTVGLSIRKKLVTAKNWHIVLGSIVALIIGIIGMFIFAAIRSEILYTIYTIKQPNIEIISYKYSVADPIRISDSIFCPIDIYYNTRISKGDWPDIKNITASPRMEGVLWDGYIEPGNDANLTVEVDKMTGLIHVLGQIEILKVDNSDKFLSTNWYPKHFYSTEIYDKSYIDVRFYTDDSGEKVGSPKSFKSNPASSDLYIPIAKCFSAAKLSPLLDVEVEPLYSEKLSYNIEGCAASNNIDGEFMKSNIIYLTNETPLVSTDTEKGYFSYSRLAKHACCRSVEIKKEVSQGNIILTEEWSGQPCKCMCSSNIYSELTDISGGYYDVKIQSKDVYYDYEPQILYTGSFVVDY